jgi:hypothetical protein
LTPSLTVIAKLPSRREQSSDFTSPGITISVPNFCACTKARAVSAWPEMPVGKPK